MISGRVVFYHRVTKDTKITKFFPCGRRIIFADSRLLIVHFLLCLFYSAPSYAADCTNPAGAESALFYSSTQNVPMYCNGSHWVAMGQLNPAAGGSGCSTVGLGIKPEGYMFYNSDHHVLQYCDGDDWRGVSGGKVYGLPGPADCPEPGDLCPGGYVFLGWHPTSHDHLFIPPNNQGTTHQWKTSDTSDSFNAYSDGRVADDVVPNSTTYPAFRACKNFTLGGKRWYLPGRIEFEYMRAARSSGVAKGTLTEFMSEPYWTATSNAGNAWYAYAANGNQAAAPKTSAYRVRCIAR